jgi:hypothetical protein
VFPDLLFQGHLNSCDKLTLCPGSPDSTAGIAVGIIIITANPSDFNFH